MAHFCLIAVTASGETVEGAMAPFRIEDDEQGRKPHFTFKAAPGGPPDPDTGRSGFWHNPDGRWDGFVRGGRWWGLVSAGPWGPEHFDEASHETANSCMGAVVGERLLDRPERLAEIHALLIEGRWTEAGRFQSMGAWRAFVRQALGQVRADAQVSVIDCHC